MISVTCLHSTLYYYTHILAAYRKNTQNRQNCTHMWAKSIRFLSDIRHWWLKINKESLISGSLRGNFWQPLIALGFYQFGKTNVRYIVWFTFTLFFVVHQRVSIPTRAQKTSLDVCADMVTGWSGGHFVTASYVVGSTLVDICQKSRW